MLYNQYGMTACRANLESTALQKNRPANCDMDSLGDVSKYVVRAQTYVVLHDALRGSDLCDQRHGKVFVESTNNGVLS